jgi:hypothetical protein
MTCFYRRDISQATSGEQSRDLGVALEVMLKQCDPKALVNFHHIEHSDMNVFAPAHFYKSFLFWFSSIFMFLLACFGMSKILLF